MKQHPRATPLPHVHHEVYAEGRGKRTTKHGDIIPAGPGQQSIYQSGGQSRQILRRVLFTGAPGDGWYITFDPAVIEVLGTEGVDAIELVLRAPGLLELYTTDVRTASMLGRRHNFEQGYNDRWLVPVECFDVQNEYGTLTQGRSLWWVDTEEGTDAEPELEDGVPGGADRRP